MKCIRVLFSNNKDYFDAKDLLLQEELAQLSAIEVQGNEILEQKMPAQDVIHLCDRWGTEGYKPYLHAHLSRNDKRYQELINNSFHIQLKYYKKRCDLIDKKLQKQPDRGSRILGYIESMVLDFETHPSISRHESLQAV